MKTVYLIRHGKAARPDGTVNDFDRVLVERGYSDAGNVAAHLAGNGDVPDVIISSPAARAIATARVFAEKLGYPPEMIQEYQTLYDNGYHAIINILNGLDDTVESAMIVGHNPDISVCAQVLSTAFDREVKTSCAIGIAFDIDAWQLISAENGRVVLYENPATVPKEKRAVKKEVEDRLSGSITSVLNTYDAVAAERIGDRIQDASRDIAKIFVKTINSAGKKRPL